MKNEYKPHHALTLRLKPSLAQLLEDVSSKTGFTKTVVLSLALREYAKAEGIQEREVEGEANHEDLRATRK